MFECQLSINRPQNSCYCVSILVFRTVSIILSVRKRLVYSTKYEVRCIGFLCEIFQHQVVV